MSVVWTFKYLPGYNPTTCHKHMKYKYTHASTHTLFFSTWWLIIELQPIEYKLTTKFSSGTLKALKCRDQHLLFSLCIQMRFSKHIKKLYWLNLEQLDHIEEGLDTINHEMKQAERALKKMGKCCGICFMPWQRYTHSKLPSSTYFSPLYVKSRKLSLSHPRGYKVNNSIDSLNRAGQAVEEDGMWKMEDGLTADSSKNHKNWNSGATRSGRFITRSADF